MVSHTLTSQTPLHAIFSNIQRLIPPGHDRGLHLFCNTVFGVEAVGELLAVLVRGVFGEELAVCGTLEGLEAGLALDSLGCRILLLISVCT